MERRGAPERMGSRFTSKIEWEARYLSGETAQRDEEAALLVCICEYTG